MQGCSFRPLLALANQFPAQQPNTLQSIITCSTSSRTHPQERRELGGILDDTHRVERDVPRLSSAEWMKPATVDFLKRTGHEVQISNTKSFNEHVKTRSSQATQRSNLIEDGDIVTCLIPRLARVIVDFCWTQEGRKGRASQPFRGALQPREHPVSGQIT